MVGVDNDFSEVVMLCAVDYGPGKTILNPFVRPDRPITNMRTNIHGIKKETLDGASVSGFGLKGWNEARAEPGSTLTKIPYS